MWWHNCFGQVVSEGRSLCAKGVMIFHHQGWKNKNIWAVVTISLTSAPKIKKSIIWGQIVLLELLYFWLFKCGSDVWDATASGGQKLTTVNS